VVRSAGLPLNNRGAGFDLQAGHVNELGPNKRPFHTLVPTVIQHDNGARSAIGTRGGLLQPQIILQLLLWGLRQGEFPERQLDKPRLNVRPDVATSLVFAEATLPREIAQDLTLRGHRIVTRGAREPSWGPAFALTANWDGRVEAGVDPRSDGKSWVGSPQRRAG
jgi:gamma-glutamyltranspeptidase/glutathione hydrolase